MHHRSGYSWNNHSVLLAQAGRRVVVLEDGAVGGGETGRTTAHLSNALDDRYHVLERLHGREGARLAAASHGAAIDTIEAIVRQEGISCDFERLDGYLFLSPGDSSSILDAELEAAHRAGLTGVERLGGVSVANWDTGPCLRFPRQGQFHPLSYLNALVDAIRRMGGEVFGKTHCRHADQGPDPRSSQRVGALVRSQPQVTSLCCRICSREPQRGQAIH